MDKIRVKRVENQEELESVYQIRTEVFVKEQKVPEEDELDEFETMAHHYIAFWNDLPCGAARWRITNHGIKLERFAVKKEFRTKGIGRAIVQKVIDDIFEHPEYNSCLQYLHAQVQVVSFYEKFGFVKEGDIFDECGIWHYKMIRK